MSFSGRGSEDRLREDRECPNCKKSGHVHYVGSNVTHGNPYSPAADTDITHYYECRSCGHEFVEYV